MLTGWCTCFLGLSSNNALLTHKTLKDNQCLSPSYCIDLKVISFGVNQASVGFDFVYDQKKWVYGFSGLTVHPRIWTEWPQINTDARVCACTHTLVQGRQKKRAKKQNACSISLSRLLWTLQPQLFPFWTKERLWFNIKHMFGYLMALYSDYKGRRGGGGRAGTERKHLMMELLKLLLQLFLHVKEGNTE